MYLVFLLFYWILVYLFRVKCFPSSILLKSNLLQPAPASLF
nr:MAG TPA: Protein of unknown function (DUF3007) [Caudoviricetes sp.]